MKGLITGLPPCMYAFIPGRNNQDRLQEKLCLGFGTAQCSRVCKLVYEDLCVRKRTKKKKRICALRKLTPGRALLRRHQWPNPLLHQVEMVASQQCSSRGRRRPESGASVPAGAAQKSRVRKARTGIKDATKEKRTAAAAGYQARRGPGKRPGFQARLDPAGRFSRSRAGPPGRLGFGPAGTRRQPGQCGAPVPAPSSGRATRSCPPCC